MDFCDELDEPLEPVSNQLTVHSLLQKLTVAQFVNVFPHFIGV